MDFCNRDTGGCSRPADFCLQFSEPSAKLSTPNSNTAATADVCIECPRIPQPCLLMCDYSPTIRLVMSAALLGNALGSTAVEIWNQHNASCPQETLSQATVESLLDKGRRRGVFVLVADARYLVRGDFACLPSNLDLLREVGSDFHRCLGLYPCTVPILV